MPVLFRRSFLLVFAGKVDLEIIVGAVKEDASKEKSPFRALFSDSHRADARIFEIRADQNSGTFIVHRRKTGEKKKKRKKIKENLE